MLFIVPRKFIVFSFALILLTLVSGLRPLGLDGDSLNYVQILDSRYPEVNLFAKEPAFWLINEFNHSFLSGHYTTFFLIFALIGTFLKLLSIYKMSKAPYLSLLLYVFLYFILHEMTQIRTGVAAGLFLLAINYYFNKDMRSYFLTILLACLFHYSAILGLILLLFKRDSFSLLNYALLLASSFIFTFFNGGKSLSLISSLLPDFLVVKLSLYMNLLESDRSWEINIFNYYYLSLIVISMFMILNHKRIKDKSDIFLLKIFVFGVASFYFLSSIPVIAFRVSEFYLVVSIILLANLSSVFKQKSLYISLILTWGLTIFVFQGIAKNINYEILF